MDMAGTCLKNADRLTRDLGEERQSMSTLRDMATILEEAFQGNERAWPLLRDRKQGMAGSSHESADRLTMDLTGERQQEMDP